jgi:glyoxalase/bleomycin resistance protein/dioxygenase superfamily protein
MINGAHFLLYSNDPDADREFLRDILEFESVDAGRGWLIFALPPAEIAVHPASEDAGAPSGDEGVIGAALYLMCDDLRATMKHLQSKKVKFATVEEAPWGTVTTFPLPSGAKVGLYQPKHPTALKLSR